MTVKPQPEKQPSLISTLKDAAGGIVQVPSLDEVLDEIARLDTWQDKENHYYFSAVLKCFRRMWYEGRGVPCDHGLAIRECKICRFDPGKSEPGHATEQHIRALFSRVLNYGKPDGPVLNDVRFSVPVPVEWSYEEESQKKPGKYIVRTKQATVYIVGKSDTIIAGDNLTVKQFEENKSPIFSFPAKARRLSEKLGTKRIPLSLAGITEPDDPEGVVSLNQVTQLAIGCKILETRGTPPETAILRTVDRGNYRDHIEVVVTSEEWNFLYDLAIWWVKEHHSNLQFDEPPEPQFFAGYECKYCPVQKRCADDNRRLGQERVIHPVVPGISARIEALHAGKEEPLPKRVDASLKELKVAKARVVAKEAARDVKRAVLDAKQAKKVARKEEESGPFEELRGQLAKAGVKLTEKELLEDFQKYIEYGVPAHNAAKTILRHYGVKNAAKGGEP